MATPLKKVSFQSSSFYHTRNTTSVKDNDEDHPHSQPLPSFSSTYITPRENLETFLKSPLGPFEASKQASRSTGSRKTLFFDLHLHRALQLRKIVVVENLPERVAPLCNKFLSKNLTHIARSSTFPFNKDEKEGQADDAPIINENTLASSYRSRLGIPLTTVASTLIFGRPVWESIFEFTLFPREKQLGKSFATPDGFLCVTRETPDKPFEKMKELKVGEREDIQTIVKHNLHHIALWEFKSLSAGSKKTLDKFIKLEGDFTWPLCDRRERACEDSRHDQDGVVRVTGRKTGFDARDVDILSAIYSLPGGNVTGLNLPMTHPDAGSTSLTARPEAASSKSVADLEADVPMEVDQEGAPSAIGITEDVPFNSDIASIFQKNVMASIPEEEEVTDSTPASNEALIATKETSRKIAAAGTPRPSQAAVGKKVARKETPSTGARRSSRINTAKANAKKRGAKESTKKTQGADQNSTAQKPKDMAVQLWSECVKYDTTVIILNAGNYEIICIRCRLTNTLYISRVLDIKDGIYKKAQIGLQALAYYDACDRARQLEALETAIDPIFPPMYYEELHDDPYPPVHRDAASLSLTNNNAAAAYEDLLEDLRSKGKFNILLRSLSDKNKTYELCTMIRHSPSSSSEPSVSAWFLALAAKITERVYSVVAKDRNVSFSDKLIIKLAENSFEYDQLKYEYETHLRFAEEDFGIETFGIIQVPDSEMSGLLMVRSGLSLEELRKTKKKHFANKNRDNYLKAIQALHASDFLHGNLKREHFLISDAGRVSLISYKATPLIRSSSGVGKAKGKATEDKEFAKEFTIRMQREKTLAENLFV